MSWRAFSFNLHAQMLRDDLSGHAVAWLQQQPVTVRRFLDDQLVDDVLAISSLSLEEQPGNFVQVEPDGCLPIGHPHPAFIFSHRPGVQSDV